MNDSKKQPVAVHECSAGVRWWPGVCILLFSGTILILLQTRFPNRFPFSETRGEDESTTQKNSP